MFESFTQEERKKYLKFVWGRSKLPEDTKNIGDPHQVEIYDYKSLDELPQAHTCFFTIDIPPYDNLEHMTKKFKTAFELCGEIDTDYGGVGGFDEDDGYGSDY